MSGLGLLLKNISSLADDMTSLIKISAKNTVTVVGDDIAAGSQNFSELENSREFPVILSVAKGAILNKIILIPIILGISYFIPFIIPYILLLASFYLAYEGFESLLELFSSNEKEEDKDTSSSDEKEKIKESVKIDFILSLEIVLITLSSVIDKPFITKAIVVTLVSIAMVFVIYGTVLAIVKIDDLGLLILKHSKSDFSKKIGMSLIKLMTLILKLLPYVGLFAVLYVAGEIFIHNIEKLEILKFVYHKAHLIYSIISYPLISILIGGIIFGVLNLYNKIIK